MSINIETRRCFIEPFKQEYVDDFMSYRNDEDWMKFQVFKGLTKPEFEKELLKVGSLEEGKQFAIVSKETGKLIGDIFFQQEEIHNWIGYTIHPSFARQGYAQEVLEAVIKFLKEQNRQTLRAGFLSANIASKSLLEKTGFVFVEEDSGEQIYELKL